MTTETNIHVDVVSATFDDDEKPPTPSAGSSKGGLVSIKPVKYYKEDAALTADTVTAEVEINASSSAAVREGLDLVVVLDISGSMRKQDRIGKLKRAMHFLIMKLTPMDRLSICAFSNQAARYSALRSVTPDVQEELKALVDSFEAAGGTYIEGGLFNAVEVVAARRYKNGRTANIFLMSDGQQTAGDATRVNPGDVPVYTFGFGKDADQTLLSDIARKSLGGTFSSVPDDTNLSTAFSQLLGGVLTIVAQDVQLTLTPNKADDDVDAIKVSPGTDYRKATDSGTGVITIKFGTLFAGEKRRVVMTLDLKESNATAEYDATLAEAQHSFTVQGKLQKQTPQDILILRTQNPSEAPGTGMKSRDLQAEMARLEHAESIRQARELADRKLLDEARYKLMNALNALEDIMVNDGGKLVNGLRAELQQLLELMDTQELYEAQGRPYALAAELSHARQREAAKGGNKNFNDRLFSTPRMEEYIKQANDFENDPSKPVTTAGDDDKKDREANPLGAIAPELALYLQNAIQALQAIERIITPST